MLLASPMLSCTSFSLRSPPTRGSSLPTQRLAPTLCSTRTSNCEQKIHSKSLYTMYVCVCVCVCGELYKASCTSIHTICVVHAEAFFANHVEKQTFFSIRLHIEWHAVRVYYYNYNNTSFNHTIQWNLRIKDTWGPEQVSFIRRLEMCYIAL